VRQEWLSSKRTTIFRLFVLCENIQIDNSIVLQSIKYYYVISLHMSESEDGTTVTVTSKGQATIPKEFRDKLHIDTPGRVRFIENEQGEVVVRPVKRPAELRGTLATEDTETQEKSATEQLRDERDRDKTKTDKQYGLSEHSE
jgi:AbrB family looped-hinge helix DNA binding protein